MAGNETCQVHIFMVIPSEDHNLAVVLDGLLLEFNFPKSPATVVYLYDQHLPLNLT